MKYDGKYSLKTQLLKEAPQRGVAVSEESGKGYERATASNLLAIFAKLPESSIAFGASARSDGVGETPDVEITFANGTKVPVETKTQLGASFGNPSMRFDTVKGQYKVVPAMSKMQNAIKSEIQAAIQKANSNLEAMAICKQISGKPHTGLSSRGCAVSGDNALGIIAKWYNAKEGYGADYIQIGGKGLFLMPNSNDSLGIDAKLKSMGIKGGLPEFAPKKEYIAVRHKQNGRFWRPIAELKASGLATSPVNLDNIDATVELLSTIAADQQPAAQAPEEEIAPSTPPSLSSALGTDQQ